MIIFFFFSAIYVDLLCCYMWMDVGLVWTLPNLQLHTVRDIEEVGTILGGVTTATVTSVRISMIAGISRVVVDVMVVLVMTTGRERETGEASCGLCDFKSPVCSK